MGTRFIHVDIKHGYNPIMICYARRLISQTCCASTVSTVGGCILSCRPLSSEDISLLMIKFLVFPIATTQDVVGVCLNRIGKDQSRHSQSGAHRVLHDKVIEGVQTVGGQGSIRCPTEQD